MNKYEEAILIKHAYIDDGEGIKSLKDVWSKEFKVLEEACKKAQALGAIEKEYQVNLITLFTNKEVYCKCNVRANERDEQGIKRQKTYYDVILRRNILGINFQSKTIQCGSPYSFSEYKLKDYGDTWAWTKEELENELNEKVDLIQINSLRNQIKETQFTIKDLNKEIEKMNKETNASINNIENLYKEIKEIFPANEKTTTDYNHFEPYSDEYITVSSPEYTVTNSGKASGKVNASILVTLNKEMDDLDYSYYLLPQFFTYPVVNIKAPETYGSSGHFSLSGPGYLDTDTVRMMMGESNEYIISYKTTEDYSFADTQWIVYETSDPKTNLLDTKDSRIDINKVSFSTDDSLLFLSLK